MIQILVDTREKNSGIVKELVKNEISVEIKRLFVADFIISNIGIERKTVQDFVNSIIDKRLMSQMNDLKNSFEKQLLIIEGTENIYEARNVHPNAIRGMLASIALDYRIPIIQTRNYRDTAALLERIAKRTEKEGKQKSLLRKRKPLTIKEQQEILMETLPSVGPNIAKALLKKFKTIKNVINASKEDLQEVEKVGKKKAEQIKAVIEKEYS